MAVVEHCPQCRNTLPKGSPGGLCPHCLLTLVVGSESTGDAPIDCGDRDLLVGLLGLQVRIIRPDDFLAASAGCAIAPYLGLMERLNEIGALGPTELELLNAVSRAYINQFEGDVRAALEHAGTAMGVEGLGSIFDDPPTPEMFLSKLGLDTPGRVGLASSAGTVKEVPGRYSNVREFTRGGMGRVLIARDEFLSRDVVLKELVPATPEPREPGSTGSTPLTSAEVMARFLREARLTGQLEHPSIVPVYELGERLDGTLYYTMKFVRGRTLGEVLGKSGTLEKRLRYLTHYLDLCQAIAYAHSRNVIHRDIKPSNVMIGEFGETVVIDWGLAKVVGEADRFESKRAKASRKNETREALKRTPDQTAPGVLVGTPHYMAPEQARGNLLDVDQRADVYSLGVVLYELLTGKVPFDGETTRDVFLRIRAADPEPIRNLEPKAPVELISVCKRAMAPVRADRYASAAELADDIERFMTGAMVQAYRYTPWETIVHFYNRNRLMANATAVIVATLALVGSYSYHNVRSARDEALVARDQALLARDAAESARIEAENSRRSANVARKEAESSKLLAEYRQYVADVRLAGDSLAGGEAPQARQALVDAPPAMRRWEWGYLANKAWPNTAPQESVAAPGGIAGGTTRDYWFGATPQHSARIEAHKAEITSVAFSKTGGSIATKAANGEAAIWNAASRERLVAFEGADNYNGPLVLSADEQVAARSLGTTAVAVCDATTGRVLSVLEGHTESAVPVAFNSDGSHLATCGYDQRFIIWDWRNARSTVKLPTNPSYWDGDRNGRFFGQFTPDGARFATFWDHATIVENDWKTGAVIRETVLPREQGFSLEHVDFDLGVAILSNPRAGIVVGRSLSTKEVVWQLNARPGPGYRSFVYSPDKSVLAMRTQDASILLFEMINQAHTIPDALQPIAVLPEHSTYVYYDGLAFDPSGRTIAVPERDGAIEFYTPVRDASVGAEAVLSHGDTVMIAHFEDDSRYVVTACFDGKIRRWDVNTGKVVTEIAAHSGPITQMVPSHDFTLWKTSATDQSRKLLDVRNGRIVNEQVSDRPADYAGGARGPLMRISANAASRNAFRSDDSAWIHSGTTGELVLSRVADGQTLFSMQGHNGRVYRPEFTPDERKILAHGHQQSGVKVWDTNTGELLQTLNGTGQVLHSAVSPDSRYAVTAHLNGIALVWDLESTNPEPEPIHVIRDHRGIVFNADFDPTGLYLATASADARVLIFRVGTWSRVAELSTHTNAVYLVRFDPAGDRLLTGCADGKLRVFDLQGQELVQLDTGGSYVMAQWSPDGRRILAATNEGVVKVWSALPESEWRLAMPTDLVGVI